MARGDAIFARCNVDWPGDPRCWGMPDNDCRWLNHYLWLLGTKHRRTVIPARYSAGYLAKEAGITGAQLQDYLRAMCDLGLLTVTPEGCLVVEGIQDQNSRLEWNDAYPNERGNPWEKDPKYLWGNGVPATPRQSPIEKEREKDIDRENNTPKPPDGGASEFDKFWKAYPRKKSKADALKAWNQHKPPLAEVLSALKWQREDPGWARDGGKYVPYPGKWIRAGGWQDEKPARGGNGARTLARECGRCGVTIDTDGDRRAGLCSLCLEVRAHAPPGKESATEGATDPDGRGPP